MHFYSYNSADLYCEKKWAYPHSDTVDLKAGWKTSRLASATQCNVGLSQLYF